ncbi:MAG TPA: acetoacetate--CoA ligase [Actinomycetes bacterium]|nr:acetoacetate--CoA ligase [Actinomycetes bacterium]
MTDSPLWTPDPSEARNTQIDVLRRELSAQHAVDLPDTVALHSWSTTAVAEFWEAVFERWIVGDRGEGPALVGDGMESARFFPDAKVCYAENLLSGASRSGAPDATAVTFIREDDVRRTLSWQELTDDAFAFAAFLRSHGVGPGDRVAAWLPNTPEVLVAMLGTSLIGAVFTSTSPDFGVAGVLDRFGQVEPTVLVGTDGYVYAGKHQPRLERLAEVVAGLPSLKVTVVVGELTDEPDVSTVTTPSTPALLWQSALSEGAALARVEPVPLRFSDPGFILYSSGTTGAPKCIVHSGAGLAIKHAVEQRLHCDIKPGDVVFYFTTCGWMMWNWLVSALACGASLVLYDGSPFHPKPDRLWDLVDELGITFFGTSAKFIDASRKANVLPRKTHDLSTLRTIASTGSPLVDEGFEYVYSSIKKRLHLASISGGTDICGCFVAGDPTRPVYTGEIQGPVLGMAVDVYDEAGKSLRDAPGVHGELVCTEPFPSMPVSFWNDADGSRYHGAYFDRFEGIWAHGDFASWTPHGGLIIHGRSDATLNAGGVRIGTAEIYRQVERLPEVQESLAVGQAWDDDTRIVLFVRMADGVELDDALVATIKKTLRENCSPRHVPARIVAVNDLPRTRSNKLAELAVADVIHGREVRNKEALANPESLEFFRDLPELSS